MFSVLIGYLHSSTEYIKSNRSIMDVPDLYSVFIEVLYISLARLLKMATNLILNQKGKIYGVRSPKTNEK